MGVHDREIGGTEEAEQLVVSGPVREPEYHGSSSYRLAEEWPAEPKDIPQFISQDPHEPPFEYVAHEHPYKLFTTRTSQIVRRQNPTRNIFFTLAALLALNYILGSNWDIHRRFGLGGQRDNASLQAPALHELDQLAAPFPRPDALPSYDEAMRMAAPPGNWARNPIPSTIEEPVSQMPQVQAVASPRGFPSDAVITGYPDYPPPPYSQ